MIQRPSILAVDDDPTARAFISHALSALPVDLTMTSNCKEFVRANSGMSADLFLIDVELPDGDGFGLAEALRRTSGKPVVFFSIHGDQSYRFRALELGAIEYLSKPIHPRELSLRVQNLLTSLGHRPGDASVPASGDPFAPAVRRFGDFSFDLVRRCVFDGAGNRLDLTASEFEVLDLLTAQPRRIVSREVIADRLGPGSAARYNARIVDVLIWRLRKKLGGGAARDRYIATVPSRGYVFTEAVSH